MTKNEFIILEKKKHSAPRNAIITSQRGVISNFLCRVLFNFPLFIYFVTGEQISRDLQKYLSTRFDKVSVDSDLQQTIRENLYNRTVPCKFYLSSQIFTRLSSLWTLKLWCFFLFATLGIFLLHCVGKDVHCLYKKFTVKIPTV